MGVRPETSVLPSKRSQRSSPLEGDIAKGAIMSALLRCERIGSTATGDRCCGAPRNVRRYIGASSRPRNTTALHLVRRARRQERICSSAGYGRATAGRIFCRARAVQLTASPAWLSECIRNATSAAEAHAGIEALEKMSAVPSLRPFHWAEDMRR